MHNVHMYYGEEKTNGLNDDTIGLGLFQNIKQNKYYKAAIMETCVFCVCIITVHVYWAWRSIPTIYIHHMIFGNQPIGAPDMRNWAAIGVWNTHFTFPVHHPM